MSLRRILLASLLFPLGASLAQADTLITNANGYTFAGDKIIQFQAFGFNDAGKIVAVGSLADVTAKMPGAKQVDVGGKTVLPGLIDAHGHVLSLGEVATAVDLRGSRTLAEAQKRIGEFAAANPQRSWIRGSGWNHVDWKLGRFPTIADLNSVVSDRPAWLGRIDGHAGWANSKALALAGITSSTPDPAGGKIEHNPDGSPSGVLVDGAMDLIEKVLPPATEAETRAALDAALKTLASVGLTSVHDAGVEADGDRLYRDYADKNKLTVRVYGMVAGLGPFFDKAAKAGPLKSYDHDLYALRAVKLYADGALGSRGAAMLAPYSDAATRGLLFKPDAAMFAQIQRALDAGFQVNVHAIGDAGNRQILDAFQKLLQDPAKRALRNRIEHAQVVTLADIPRFKKINIIPSMQPTHATSDMNMAEDRVGLERIKGAYAWRTFLQQGSRIACGSDFPIESPNPFWGIHAAVTRQDMAHAPVAGWHPDQAMSLKEAFRCFTIDAAYAAHQEKVLGTLEAGKWADFIVTDQDLFTMPTYDIHKMVVLQTWLAGRKVYAK